MNYLHRTAIAMLSISLSTALHAAAATTSGSDDGGLVIAPSVKVLAEQPLDAKKVDEFCRTLCAVTAGERDRAVAVAALTKDRKKTAELLIANLDPKKATESETRLGALKGIDVVRPTDQKTSIALGLAAAADPIVEVRKAATALVKSRVDDYAIGTMLNTLTSTYDAAGNMRDKILGAMAADALRDLNDKRVYQALLYYVTMELRLTNISTGSLTTRQIDSFAVNSGANVNVLVQLAFPIQFPELSMERVRTTVKAPALNALETLSGENFGNDVEKWERWGRKLK